MILQYMMRDARPTGGVWALSDVVKHAMMKSLALSKRPMVIRAHGSEIDARMFHSVADILPWGTVIVFDDLQTPASVLVGDTASHAEWREWRPAGVEPHETAYVRSHYDGNTYGTHQRYLIEAVRLTEGPVLELGSGDGSTPILHSLVAASSQIPGRLLITVDNNDEWLERYTGMTSERHRFARRDDPAKFLDESSNTQMGVVFVDHAPGNTRADAVEKARKVADYVVVHDTEDNGYEIWDTLQSFKYVRHFRYMRPWTSVVSMTRPIFDDPYNKES